MFGYTDAELARERKRVRRRLRVWLIGLQLVVAMVVAAPFYVLDQLYRPGAVQPWVDRWSAPGAGRMLVGEFVMLPLGSWFSPEDWRFAVTGVGFAPADPMKPSWSTKRVTTTLPWPTRQGRRSVSVHMERLDVTGLRIEAHQQRPPPPWEARQSAVTQLSAGEIHFLDAAYTAPEDPPLGAAEVHHIVGVVRQVVFRPGAREVSGVGQVRAPAFRTGNITVTALDLPVFRLDRSSLHLEGSLVFAGTPATLSGDITTFHRKPDVTLHVDLRGGRLQRVIETATGRSSPLDGEVDMKLTVLAGGPRPRGGAVMHGFLDVREGSIQLARNTRYVVLDAIRIAPWVRLDPENRVLLEPMSGRLTLTRGTVTLRELVYPVGRRTLRLDGQIGRADLYLRVHLLPVDNPGRKREALGLGMVVEGPLRQQRFRLATREDLLADEPWRDREATPAE